MNAITRAKYAELQLTMKEAELFDKINKIATEIANDEDSDLVDVDTVISNIVSTISTQYTFDKKSLFDTDMITINLSQFYY